MRSHLRPLGRTNWPACGTLRDLQSANKPLWNGHNLHVVACPCGIEGQSNVNGGRTAAGHGGSASVRLSMTTQIFLAFVRGCTLDVRLVHRGGKVVSYNSLQAWLTKASKDARGLTMKTLDGTANPLYPPFAIGEDFIAGVMVEGSGDAIAYSYNSLISVQPLSPKPKGF
jgi:hypothetical protein